MVTKKPMILICDDDRRLCGILENALSDDGYVIESAHSGTEAIEKLRRDSHDMILLDLKLPDMSGLETLKKIQLLEKRPVAVMISGQGDIRTAVEATRTGAFDFLEKPLDANRVLLTIKNVLDRCRIEKEKANLLQSVLEQYRMIGKGEALTRIHYLIERAARTNSKVLIEGENGTGKELVARAIHHQSARAYGPFIAVNCAAIPESLIESELFGYKKGSFTGAVSDKPGRFQAADNGTLFLDEIGDMSLMTQAKVLRTLEESTLSMLGSSESIPVDVRVIAATNKNLSAEMESGRFREDLYFRLNVLNIRMPALRERKEDIPDLVDYFIQMFCHEHGIRLKTLEPDALGLLSSYSWPGNVRELKNAVEKIVVLVESAQVKSEDVESILSHHPAAGDMKPISFRHAKESFERRFISEKLAAHNGNVTKTALSLKIPRTYLHKKMNKLGIRHKEVKTG